MAVSRTVGAPIIKTEAPLIFAMSASWPGFAKFNGYDGRCVEYHASRTLRDHIP